MHAIVATGSTRWSIEHFSIAFGGFKQSGIGREGGTEGMYPYVEAKTIILDQPAAKAG